MRIFLLIILLISTSVAGAKDKCLVFLIHGKWGAPDHSSAKILKEKISQICTIEQPVMPWSRYRNYDQTYEDALKELSKKVQDYRKKNFKKIIFVGHSFGANGAMAYQSYIGDVDAIVALAAGHSPYNMYRNGYHAGRVIEAESEIKKGKTETLIKFTDVNSGNRQKDFSIRADVFFSYFNPDGLGHMPKSAENFKKPIPFLYIEGNKDPIRGGPSSVFSKAPSHPLSKYLSVDADHMDTPEVASDQVVEWLKVITQ